MEALGKEMERVALEQDEKLMADHLAEK